MCPEYSQMTAANAPQSVRILLISQMAMLILAILLEFSLFFTTIYETFAPYVCYMKFSGKEVCLDYNGEDVSIKSSNSFLTLLWPFSLTELVFLIAILVAKLIYFLTFKWATIIKIFSVSLLGLLIGLEIYLLTEFDQMQYSFSYDYEIKLYPIIAKFLIGILVICICIAMWIEAAKAFKFKIDLNIQQSSRSLLSIQ